MRKIDIVYLWLDPNDPKWKDHRNEWLDRLGLAVTAVSEDTTWIQNDELRYALRSVDRFAPWINHIYIITGFGQVPDWLDTAHPKITIVNDFDIMPGDAIPTFNSNAIESCMVNIPGLSEYFLLSNDDMFFGREIKPEFFFDNNDRPIVWYEHNRFFGRNYDRAMDRVGLWYKHHVSLFRLLEKVFGRKYHRRMPAHNIDPYRKSHIQAAQNDPQLRDEINATIHNRFRSPSDIPRFVYSVYDYIKGRGVLVRAYPPRSWRHPLYNIWHWLRGDFRNAPQYHQTAETVPVKLPLLFCINKARTNEFAKIFPDKSGFEK